MKKIQRLIIAVITILSVTSPLTAHAAEVIQSSSSNSPFNEEASQNTTSSADKSVSKEIKQSESLSTTNGVKKTGWIASGDKWYFYNTDGSRISNQWITYNNKRYYLGEDGIMAVGLTKIDDITYYFASNGDLSTGWQQINNTWYYCDPAGIIKTGWITDKNKKYYLTESGAMAIGWTTINNKDYYFDKDGAIKTGWIGIGKDIFYLDTNGAKVTDSTIDSYKLDEDGKLVLINNDKVPDIDKYFENKNINIDTSECVYKSQTHGISESVFNGIDISNYDGYVDFNSVKQSGIKAVYMKASESNYFIDQYAAENSVNAKKAGLKVGYYHFLTGTSAPEEQARLFYNCIKDKPNDLKPCVDVEVSPSTASEYTIRFINEFKKLSNMDVVIYTYSNFISNFDSSLSQYSLWEANYNDTPFSLPSNGIWTNRAGHQYSSKGTVPGVNAQEVDLDVFNHSIFLQ